MQVHTAVTDQVFSAWIYGLDAMRMGHKSEQNKKQGSVIYNTDQDNVVVN